MTSAAPHPRDALFEPGEPTATPLPVCDHYSGVEARMRKSLELQAELGPVFDVTLDGEDGAPVGGEVEHAHLMAELLTSPANRFGRVGVRVQPLEHRCFDEVLDTVIAKGGQRLAYLMLPKPRGLADVERASAALNDACRRHSVARHIPLHTLVETHGALRDVQAIAAHPYIESVSFGLMDFVSAHRGAIPPWAMSADGQFDHPLVVRAKLEIAAACHSAGKTPSHCVVTEFKNAAKLQEAAEKACQLLGFTRMWSIHPSQIQPIIDAFSPSVAEIDSAIEILQAAQAAHWAPIRHDDTLHDRASYRYYWHLLERAHRSATPGVATLPAEVRHAWFSETTPPA
jgi:citrate lyase subunit beta/citryl-CoA lyase